MKITFEKEKVQRWLAMRNARESLLIFLTGFAVIYFFWTLLFELNIQHQAEDLAKKNQQLSALLTTEQQKLQMIENILTKFSFTQGLHNQQKLQTEMHSVDAYLKRMEPQLVSPVWFAQMMNDLIAQQAEVNLLSLKTFIAEPWLKTKNPLTTYSYQATDIYRHVMEIEFSGSYFNTLAFLAHLEKLSWPLYWDHLSYQVTHYPQAKTVVRFYVLSDEKG